MLVWLFGGGDWWIGVEAMLTVIRDKTWCKGVVMIVV